MPTLPIDFANIALALVAIILLLLYLHELATRRKLEADTDQFLEELREKGWESLHESFKKSEDIIGEAELEGIKVAAQSKLQSKKFEADYSKNLADALNASRQNIMTAQGELIKFMQDLQKRSSEFEEAQKAAGQQRINQLFDKVETNLSDFLVQTAQKTTSSIELELKASRQMIDTYKAEQLKLIDENIIAMMERTMSIVLAKKLSLKEHMDLIYEALEKAKVEKFIV
jgi:hypothetical protein